MNTGWLTFEKLFRMGLTLVVSIVVARYLGPSEFGLLSFATSLVSFLSTFIYLGLSGIVIRDIVKYPEQRDIIMGTTFAIKIIGSFIAYSIIIATAYFKHSSEKEFWLLIIIGAGLFFRSFETIDYYFHSITSSVNSVLSKSCSVLLTSILSIIFVFLNASLIYFAFTKFLELAISAIFLVVIYFIKKQNLFSWKFSIAKAVELFKQSWILILSSFFSIVYLKIDQIMLRWMIGPSEVGIYSIAVNLSEVWYFLPTSIALSVYPALIKKKNKDLEEYHQQLQKIFDILFLIAITVAILITLISKPAVQLLYGKAYSEAGSILMIHIWAGVFIFLRALFSRIIFIENLLEFSLITHLSGAIVNVLLNFILIKPLAGYGAAIATLISYASASYVSLFFSQKTRPYAVMMTKSMLLPLRIRKYQIA